MPTIDPIYKLAAARRTSIGRKVTPKQKREICESVCDRIARGEYLINIAEDRQLPHSNTIRNWINADPELKKAYNVALNLRAEVLSESVVKIADEEPPMYTDAHGHKRIDPAGVRLLRLRVMARQWLATAHLRHKHTEQEAQVETAETQTYEYKVPTPEDARFRMIKHSPFLTKQWEDLCNRSRIEGCTPRELFDRTLANERSTCASAP